MTTAQPVAGRARTTAVSSSGPASGAAVANATRRDSRAAPLSGGV